MGQGISGSELARRLGVTEGAVRKAKKTGRITVNADGTFDAERAFREWGKRTRAKADSPVPPHVPPGTSPADLDEVTASLYQRERALTQRRTRELLDINLAEKKGELRPIAAVNAYVSAMIIETRDTLLRIAPELADRLAAQSDPIKCREIIETEINQSLRKLAVYNPNVT